MIFPASGPVALERPDTRFRSAALAVAGVIAVALSAQISVPLPYSPVPITLQPLAVLLVGGLLGPRLGALTLGAYLVAGIAGFPVFSPAVPLQGVARLLGPTGGYLLAFPLAAALAGRGTERGGKGWGGFLIVTGHLLTGTAVIHLAGAAQLALLGGEAASAIRNGVIPFLAVDGVRVLLVALLLHGLGRRGGRSSD